MSLQAKYIAIGLLFVVHFLFGYRLRKSGKPFNSVELTIHKLAALAALVILALAIRQMWSGEGAGGLEIAVIAITGLLWLIAIVTGGWLSADKPPNALLSIAHKITPYFVLLGTVAILYLLL